MAFFTRLPIKLANKGRIFATFRKSDLEKYYTVLGLPEDSNQEQIRAAYLKLVKLYHPDSKSSEADSVKFQIIDEAFKILINQKSKERWQGEEPQVKEHDIKHTAPQHRQHLSYGGIGSGNIFQREKQYHEARAIQAADNVFNHRIAKAAVEEGALLDKNKPPQNRHKLRPKSGIGFERLVEDLIQESISKGEFNNLAGCGKPLKTSDTRNPYVDFVTHKVNEILIDNGFTPEWITLQKEIRDDIEQLRACLLAERAYFSDLPNEINKWNEVVDSYNKTVNDINKKIDKFNLDVPILNKQLAHVSLTREGNRALQNGKYDPTLKHTNEEVIVENRAKIRNIFEFIDNLFRNK